LAFEHKRVFCNINGNGRAIAQEVSRWLTSHRGGPESSHVGFVMDKVELGQVFSEYFGFPSQSSFHQFLHNHHHLSSGAGTTGQYWPQYQETQSRPTKNNNNNKYQRQKTTTSGI
jgi:hypothetical protein